MFLRKRGMVSIYDPILKSSIARKKEAYGYAKHTLNSQIENIIKHDMLNGDEQIDMENLQIKLFDKDGLYYNWWLEVNCDHPKIEICGEERCGTCYEQELLSSRDKVKDRAPLEYRYNQDKHLMQMMRPRNHD